MFVGEAPGYYEDKFGVPFCGNSGKLLNIMLDLIGLTRQDTYITNIIKCRPPHNRTPYAKEIENCNSHLQDEIKTINPKIIILLGNTALNTYFNKSTLKVGRVRLYTMPIKGRIIIATYHPSYILRGEGDARYKNYIQDFKVISKAYRKYINPLTTTKI